MTSCVTLSSISVCDLAEGRRGMRSAVCRHTERIVESAGRGQASAHSQDVPLRGQVKPPAHRRHRREAHRHRRAPPWGCAQVTPGLGLFPGLGSWATLPPRAQAIDSNSTGSVGPGASKTLGPLTTQVTGASVAEEDRNMGFEPLRKPFQSASTFSLPGAPAQPLDSNKTAVSAGPSSLA